MWNARLEEAQAGIKIAERNINNLRYADDTTLMAESEEELKSLLMKVKEESEKADLKLIIQKMKIIVSHPIPSCIGKTMETVTDVIFLHSKITADGDCSHEIKILAPWKESYDIPRKCIKKQRHPESPLQVKPKKKHIKTHINQANRDKAQRKDIKSSKEKATGNIQ